MKKKLLKLTRTLLILAIWTFVYTYCVRFLVLKAWQFDILSQKSWNVLQTFWSSGGVIKTGKDYLFAFSLLLIIPIWYIGLKKFLKVGIITVLLSPVYLFNKVFASKEDEMSHVKLKNMGISKKVSVEDIISEKMAQINKDKSDVSHAKDIRKSIKDKLKSMD